MTVDVDCSRSSIAFVTLVVARSLASLITRAISAEDSRRLREKAVPLLARSSRAGLPSVTRGQLVGHFGRS